jgi:hypothetical protein
MSTRFRLGVPAGSCGQPPEIWLVPVGGQVRTFGTTTGSLLELQGWLVAQGVSLCVMEAASTYGKPPFYLLEDITEC